MSETETPPTEEPSGGGSCDTELLISELKPVLEQIASELSAIKAMQQHIHDKHWSRTSGSVPRAALLVNEYFGNQDLDGNGLVYGKHFYVSDECPEKPPMLSNIRAREEAIEMTWPEYLASLEEED
jgi:hypothetical protein